MFDHKIRWMIRRDMPGVLAIEEAAFEFPWTEEEFIRCLRQRNCIGMVCEHNDTIVGFMIYELYQNRLHLLNFAVDPSMKRFGVGKSMFTKLSGKLSIDRRNRITLEVRETNLNAQLFFRTMGFRAIATLRKFYEETMEDCYLMQYMCEHLKSFEELNEQNGLIIRDDYSTHGLINSFRKFFYHGK